MASRRKSPATTYILEHRNDKPAHEPVLQVAQEPAAYGEPAGSRGDMFVVRGAGISREAFDAWVSMFPLMEDSIRERRADALMRAAKVYQPEATITMADVSRLEMQKKAAESVLVGTEWLSAADIGKLTERSGSNPAALAHRWKTEGKVFAVNWNGRDLFPRYLFDERLHPLPVVGKILALFGDIDPWRIAAWFESANAWLASKRPREMLDEPSLVLEAAQNRGNWRHG